MDGRDVHWTHFDRTVDIEAASWGDLRAVVAAYDDLTRHGQVVVHLRGDLVGHASDSAAFLAGLLGINTTVIESGTELLIARRPHRSFPDGLSGDRQPRRPRSPRSSGSLRRDLPTAEGF